MSTEIICSAFLPTSITLQSVESVKRKTLSLFTDFKISTMLEIKTGSVNVTRISSLYDINHNDLTAK